MRLLIVALMLLMTPAYALERVPVALVKELSPPALDADGCALPAAGRHTERNTDGVLVACGMLVNDRRDGYWVYADGRYFMHGRYHAGQKTGTWLALAAADRFGPAAAPVATTALRACAMRLAAAVTDGLAAWALAISSTNSGSPKLCHQLLSAATEPWCGNCDVCGVCEVCGSGLYHWLAA